MSLNIPPSRVCAPDNVKMFGLSQCRPGPVAVPNPAVAVVGAAPSVPWKEETPANGHNGLGGARARWFLRLQAAKPLVGDEAVVVVGWFGARNYAKQTP